MLYLSICKKVFGMDGRKKVSVIMKMSMFNFCMSCAIKEHAFWLVLLTFFSEKTFRSPITGSFVCCDEDFKGSQQL